MRYGPKWTLIHIWSTACSSCWRDVSALNEMLNPPSSKLVVVVIVINDTADTIATFSHLYPVEFNNLLGGDWTDGQVAKAFDPIGVPMDVIIDPAGHATFAGIGEGSLQSALEYWKGLALQ